MVKFETLNELCLMITNDGGYDYIFAKKGAFIAGECNGAKNFKFTKVLLGPEENAGRAFLGQLARRFTGENFPLMKAEFSGRCITYYANEQQHVVVYHLQNGETISVESENILAFSKDCKYGVRFIGDRKSVV